jgi:hypothetical protein
MGPSGRELAVDALNFFAQSAFGEPCIQRLMGKVWYVAVWQNSSVESHYFSKSFFLLVVTFYCSVLFNVLFLPGIVCDKWHLV